MPRSLCRIAGRVAKISALRSRSLGKVSTVPAPGGAAGLPAGAVDGRAGAVAISATADPSGYPRGRPARCLLAAVSSRRTSLYIRLQRNDPCASRLLTDGPGAVGEGRGPLRAFAGPFASGDDP